MKFPQWLLFRKYRSAALNVVIVNIMSNYFMQHINKIMINIINNEEFVHNRTEMEI